MGEQARSQEVERGSDERATFSPVDIFHPNVRRHPNFRNAKSQVVVLDPCETLVVPKSWWIYDVTLESCVTLFHRFYNRTNQASICDDFRSRLRDDPLMPEDAARNKERF